MIQKGFKVTDKFEGCSAAFTFTVNGSLDLVSANKQAAYSAMPNSQQIASGAGNLAHAVITGINSGGGGAAGLAGFVIGQLFDTDSKLGIVASFQKDPVKSKGFFGEKISGSDDEHYSGVANIHYKLEKGKEASDDIVLKMAVDEWIDHFMPVRNVNTQIADTKPVETPAPVVTNTTPALIPAETTQPQVQ